MKRFGKDCKYWLWCVIVALGVTSCSGNDEPGGTGNNTPSYPVTIDTTSVLVQRILSRTDLVTKVTRVTTEERFPGLVLSEIDFNTAKARQHAYVAEVDLSKLTIATTTPYGEVNVMPTRVNTIPEQAKYLENSGRRVHVAVNGGFWVYKKASDGEITLIKPKELFWKDGYPLSDWWQDPNHEFTVYMTRDGSVDIDVASNVVKRSAEIYQALGGLGCLIRRGVFNDGISSIGTYLCDTHPRTAIGLSEDKQTRYVVVVDGRRVNYAEGLDIYELADFMWGIGSYDAVNYDGGGSSIMVLRDENVTDRASFVVRNRPSDGTPRAVGNGFAIVEK